MTRIENITICLDIERLPHSLQEEVMGGENEWLYEIIDFIDSRFSELMHNSFLYNDVNLFYFELNDIAGMGLDTISILNFFEKLITIFNAEYSVFISVGSRRVNCNDLSEGQRQLIKILGMLGVCKNEDTLVLMDEPDAHMNPAWKYNLKSTIDKCLSEAVNTQAIIATHDPLVINGVDKKFIRIFTQNLSVVKHNNLYITKVVEPSEDTIGMGIDGLLQSEYYGLRTSYDSQADRDFRERQDLYIKVINDKASAVEKDRLVELTKRIGAFHVSNNTIDFLYDDFLSIYRDSEFYLEDYLTPKEIKERQKKIHAIIESLFEDR